MEIKDGGPAFPVHQLTNGGFVPVGGMTLRDYFAGQALIGILGRDFSPPKGIGIKEYIALVSYEYADTMLKAREPKTDNVEG